MYMVSAFKIFGSTLRMQDEFLSIIGSLASLFDCFTSFVWASSVDYCGFKITFSILIVIEIIISSTVYLVASYKESYFIWV